MKIFSKKSLPPFFMGGAFGALVFLIGFFQPSSLLDWSYIATIITALSVGAGAWTIIYQKKEDDTKRIFDLVNQYNSEIFPQSQEIFQAMDKEFGTDSKKNSEILSGIIPVMILSSFMKTFKERWMLEYQFFSIESGKSGRKDLRQKTWNLLRELEIFSALILHSGLYKNLVYKEANALNVVVHSFVEIVERFPLTILSMAPKNETPYYREMVTLYDIWKGGSYRPKDWEKHFKEEMEKFHST